MARAAGRTELVTVLPQRTAVLHRTSPVRRRRRAVRRRMPLVLATAVGLILSFPSPAGAAPRPTVAEVKRRVERLQHAAEVATERYNETREQLASLTVRVKAAQAQLARQREEVAAAREQLGRLAAETYRRGKLSTLDVLLGEDPDSALARAGLLPSLGERQVGATKRLAEGERRLAAAEAALSAQQRKLADAGTRLAAHKATVHKRLAQARLQLSRLEAAERLALLRAQRGGGGAGRGGRLACQSLAVNAPDVRVKSVLEYACAQIGDSYVWAAEGPDTWDCSGLTMAAWRRAGVSLPHSSRMQATYGSRVAGSELRPGDLVFFHSPISHVGIYLGNGFMVHAPRTGDVVKVARMFRTPTAAVRL